MNTAQWIRERRLAAGLSQAELARRVGASQPMISLWERGASEPPAEALARLRAVLDGQARASPVPTSLRRREPHPQAIFEEEP